MNRGSAKATPRIVLVEDDERLAAAVSEYLEKNGLDLTLVNRGDAALNEINRVQPDLVVLDVMLPGIDGMEVCRRLRAANNYVPVLMLTAKDEDFDRVLGLEIGADDYLIKPIQPRVLLAHIKAMLRRLDVQSAEPQIDTLSFGELSISRVTREVNLRGGRVQMTAAEFDLLWLLATQAGKVVHRDEILKQLRGLEQSHDDRSVDARLYRLRKRFGETDHVLRRIKTVRPHGYMFSVEPW
jgi:two-component system, OmpR family, response regulator RstA